MVDINSKRAMAQVLSNTAHDDPFGISGGYIPTEPGDSSYSPARANVSSAETDAMKKVLENMNGLFSAMNGTMDVLTEQAEYDPELRTALVTERTARGSRIGSWEIVKHGDNDFDVIHTGTGEPIAKSLKIYEAAVGLAKALNSGKTLTDEPVRQILVLESRYAQNLDKAAHFKQMAKKLVETGNTKRAAIQEDRFDVARDSAVEDRERLLKLAGLK